MNSPRERASEMIMRVSRMKNCSYASYANTHTRHFLPASVTREGFISGRKQGEQVCAGDLSVSIDTGIEVMCVRDIDRYIQRFV